MPTRLSDRGGVAAAYAAGGVLVIAVTVIMAWLVWQGLSTISWDFLTTGPAPGSLEQGVAGGILPALPPMPTLPGSCPGDDGNTAGDDHPAIPQKQILCPFGAQVLVDLVKDVDHLAFLSRLSSPPRGAGP